MYIGVTNYPDFLKTQSVQTTVAGQTSLTGLNYDPGNVEVYKNGSRLRPDQYAAPDGMNITLYAAAALNDKFDIVSREENAVGSDVVSVNGKTGVVVLDHYDFPDMPWLDGTGRIPSSLLPTSVVGAVVYQGTWNATTAAPSASPSKGQYWVVSVQGTTSLSGINQWYVGDTAIYNGTTWDRLDGSANEVLSVNGRTGNVVITSADVETALSWRPVQEGGGLRQVTGHKVQIGWGFDGLTATVDTTDVGTFVFSNPGNEYINYGRLPHTLLLSDNKGLIHVGTDLPAYGAQYLRLRAEPSLWGSPYGELLIGSNGQNKFSGYTILEGGAETITPAPSDSSSKVATTAFVQNAIGGFTSSEYVLKAGDTMSNSLTILGAGTGTLQSLSSFGSSFAGSGWTNPNNMLGTPNGTLSTDTPNASHISGLVLLNLDTLSIPSTAIISGVEIKITHAISGNMLDGTTAVALRYNGTLGSFQALVPPTSLSTITFGSNSFLWGHSITPSMFSDGLMQVYLTMSEDTGEAGSVTFAIDAVEVKVYYSEPGVNAGTLFLGNSNTRFLQYDGNKYLFGGNANLSIGGSLNASSGTISGNLNVGAPTLALHATNKEYVDDIRPNTYRSAWTDVINVATSTYTTTWTNVKSTTIIAPTFASAEKIALIMYQSNVHCYTDGTTGHGTSIEWRLLWNGVQIAYVQTNATEGDNSVQPIIFMVPVAVNSASSNSLVLQAWAHSTSGNAQTNHGQNPSSTGMGQSEINIMYF